MTHALVDLAKIREVGIRNHEALRYGVPTQVWEQGETIDAWVNKLSVS